MAQPSESDLSWPRVILLGDSITQYSFQESGWGAIIQDFLSRKCDVYNRGYSGYNTKMILSKLNHIINEKFMKNVAFVTLFLGANDAALPEEKPIQHVPMEEYGENIGKLIDKIQSFGVKPNQIIVITPPPVNEKALLEDILKKGEGETCTRTNENAKKYSRVCLEIAKEKKCREIDLWSNMMADEDDFPSYLSDGLHLSEKGNSFLADLLESHISELTCDIPYILPYWRDFTYDD